MGLLGRSRRRTDPHSDSSAAAEAQGGEKGQREWGLARVINLTAAQEVVNKSAEFCITLLVVYLLIELSAVPRSCESGGKCLRNYVVDVGAGEMDNSLILSSCASLRESCSISPAGQYAASADDDDTIAGAFLPIINFCNCLYGNITDPGALEAGVYCEFQSEQLQFFWLGLLVIGLLEASSREGLLRHLRPLFMLCSAFYFVAAVIVFSNEATGARCGSKEFELKAETVFEISLASLLVLVIVCLMEAIVAAQSNRHNALLACCCPRLAGGPASNKPTPSSSVASSSRTATSLVNVAPVRGVHGSSPTAALRRSEPPVSEMLDAIDSASEL